MTCFAFKVSWQLWEWEKFPAETLSELLLGVPVA
jgi:hypothetical protein